MPAIHAKTAPAPLSDCDVRDPRTLRTRQLLQGALRELMRSKGFDEISVQAIAEAATVNRATFYDHYPDKFALLEAMVAGGFHRLLDERKVRYDGTCPSAASAIILATCDYLAQSRQEETECQRQNAFESGASSRPAFRPGPNRPRHRNSPPPRPRGPSAAPPSSGSTP